MSSYPHQSAILQQLVNTYTRRLGGKRPARIQVVPGVECCYNPYLHRISIGSVVIMHTSAETCRVIVAHEVGHSLQPELTRARHLTWAGILCLVLAVIIPVGGILSGVMGPIACVIASMLFSALSVYLVTMGQMPGETKLEREYDADACSVQLVGRAAAYNALVEFGEVFAGGQQTHQSMLRLNRIKNPLHEAVMPYYRGAAVVL